jgi:hypothetical protein
MELGKPKCPFTWEEGPRHQNHIAMNVWVLNNLLAQFCHNEQKVVARAKKHTNLEWGRFNVALRNTPMVLKLVFVKLAFSHILQLLGMTSWGVGSILFNVQAKVEHNEDLAIMIQMTQVKYAKALKVVGWNKLTKSLHLIRQCGTGRLEHIFN